MTDALTDAARHERLDHSVKIIPGRRRGPMGDAMTIAARSQGLSDVAAGRLDRKTIDANFSDLHPPLSLHEARVEAERCYFCFDAPVPAGLPDLDRHSDVHPPGRRRQSSNT